MPSSVVRCSRLQTSCHLIGRENCGLLVLQASLLQALHRVARNHFEKILAPTEKAPRDPKMIVDAYWRKPVERAQPCVEFSMADGVDRVSTVARDEPIENISDLIERHLGLLMASDPQRGAFTERDFARSVAAAFRAEEPCCSERDDVCERLLAITEIPSDALAPVISAGTATSHGVRGLPTATTLRLRAMFWSLLVAILEPTSIFLCYFSFFCVSEQDCVSEALIESNPR